jgi:hypothetical protein
MVLLQSIVLEKRPSKDLYEGIKTGESWAFDYLERTLFPSHQLELNGDKDLAFDMYHDVIMELYLRIVEGRLEKIDMNGTGLIISWVKRHLDWKRRDYWKSSRYRDVIKLNEIHEQTYTCNSDVESIVYFQQIVAIIEGMSLKYKMILKDKLIDDLEWKVIYQKYPHENEGSLRVLFSNSLKTLRGHLTNY